MFLMALTPILNQPSNEVWCTATKLIWNSNQNVICLLILYYLDGNPLTLKGIGWY